MKIRFNISFLVILFALVNLALILFVSYLIFLSQASELNLNKAPKSIALARLDKNIKDLNVASRAFIIYDAQNRAVLTGKNEHFRFSPASTAKIMTALIVLDKYPLEEELVANNIYQVQGSKMDLEEGEKITVRNLLYGLMLPSGNDAAFVLSNNFPGGGKKFVEEMNRKAKELKLDNTQFFDPDGYSDDNYTTAYDLARLGAYALENKEFAKIVFTKKITVYDVDNKIMHKLSNLNELLGIDGVTGIKTGFTEEAGGVLVTSIVKQGKLYILVVLNSPDRFADTRNIIENAIKNLNLISY